MQLVTSCSAGVLTCPTLSTPANAATGISLTPTLTWTASTNSASYDVYLGTSVGGATLLTNTVSTSYTVLSGVLSGNTTYYWYVAPRGCDNSTIACDGGAYSFTTQNPPPAFDEPCGAVALTVGTSVAILHTHQLVARELVARLLQDVHLIQQVTFGFHLLYLPVVRLLLIHRLVR